MDFSISPRVEDFRARIGAFVEANVKPLDADKASYDTYENIRLDLLERLRSKARAEGLWCLQLKPETGGQGLGKMGMAVCYEEMNRSIFGPACFNAAAPDDGNMMLLEAIGTEAQKDWWLKPVVAGKQRSAFAMTEPHPGGGSDPGMIRTTAEKQGEQVRHQRPQMVHHGRRGSPEVYRSGADLG
jgi:acyl-CoA dehydrogenase